MGTATLKKEDHKVKVTPSRGSLVLSFQNDVLPLCVLIRKAFKSFMYPTGKKNMEKEIKRDDYGFYGSLLHVL